MIPLLESKDTLKYLTFQIQMTLQCLQSLDLSLKQLDTLKFLLLIFLVVQLPLVTLRILLLLLQELVTKVTLDHKVLKDSRAIKESKVYRVYKVTKVFRDYKVCRATKVFKVSKDFRATKVFKSRCPRTTPRSR